MSSTCRVSFLATPDTDCKHKFSLTHFIHLSYLSDGLTFTNKPYDSQPIDTCDVPRQSGGSTQIPSLTGYDPCRLSFKNIDAEAIVLEDLEPRRSELERNLGTDPYQIQERLMRNLLTEEKDEFGKVGEETSCLQSQMHADYDSAENTADSDLEDGELRKNAAGFATVYAKSTRLLILSNANRTGETCCIVLIWKRKTGRSIQWLCFQKR